MLSLVDIVASSPRSVTATFHVSSLSVWAGAAKPGRQIQAQLTLPIEQGSVKDGGSDEVGEGGRAGSHLPISHSGCEGRFIRQDFCGRLGHGFVEA